MREYSANIGDALQYKIRVFAQQRSKQEKERTVNFQNHVKEKLAKMRKEAKKNEKNGFSNSAKTNPEPQFRTYDFLSTTNNCTIG